MMVVVRLARPWLAAHLAPAGLVAACVGVGVVCYIAMLPLVAGGLLKEIWALRRPPVVNATPAA